MLSYESVTEEFADSKRKAVDQPDIPTPNKRNKNSHTISPEKEKKTLAIVPFQEKVRQTMRQPNIWSIAPDGYRLLSPLLPRNGMEISSSESSIMTATEKA